MENNQASIMADKVVDALTKTMGRDATNFQIKDINEDPNQKTFIVEFEAYNFFWVGIDYEKGRVTPYIVEGTHTINLKNITDWWEKMTLDLWVEDLVSELKSRIPNKYLEKILRESRDADKLVEIAKSIENIIKQIDAKIPLVDHPGVLEMLREMYQAALQEIEKDGELKTDLTNMIYPYLDSYGDYENNPLPEDMYKLELAVKELSRFKFVYSFICNDIFVREILRDSKTSYSTSQPLIYFDKGKFYLAAFAFFYTKDNAKNGVVDRPIAWALADIETGEIIKKYETKEKDFSDASYNVKYSLRPDGKYDLSTEYYNKAFEILDSVRKKIINGETFPKEEYKRYLKAILANVPKEYQRFYTDLSV